MRERHTGKQFGLLRDVIAREEQSRRPENLSVQDFFCPFLLHFHFFHLASKKNPAQI